MYLRLVWLTSLGYSMWEQQLVLKVRKRKRLFSWDHLKIGFWCDLLPLCFALQKFPLKRQRCILNWSTYLFMDEGPNIIEQLISNQKAPRLSSFVKSSCHLNMAQLLLLQQLSLRLEQVLDLVSHRMTYNALDRVRWKKKLLCCHKSNRDCFITTYVTKSFER